jgi:hypothetical protein
MQRFSILQLFVLHSQCNTSVFPISEKRKQKQKSTFKRLQPDSEGKWRSNEKIEKRIDCEHRRIQRRYCQQA